MIVERGFAPPPPGRELEWSQIQALSLVWLRFHNGGTFSHSTLSQWYRATELRRPRLIHISGQVEIDADLLGDLEHHET